MTPYQLAEKHIGLKEVPGQQDNPEILAMLKLDNNWPEHDEVPWCSAFVNWVCHKAGVERSRKLNARSWLDVGRSISIHEARPVSDIVILSRTSNPASGHVGFYSKHDDKFVYLLGGNQGDAVSIAKFPLARVLGVRRMA
jgi:uncharacterized protein (TIGR02594 family)